MKLVKKRYLFAVMVFLSLGFTTENEERNIYSVPMDYLVEVPQLATVEPAQNHNSHQSTISFSSFDEKDRKSVVQGKSVDLKITTVINLQSVLALLMRKKLL